MQLLWPHHAQAHACIWLRHGPPRILTHQSPRPRPPPWPACSTQTSRQRWRAACPCGSKGGPSAMPPSWRGWRLPGCQAGCRCVGKGGGSGARGGRCGALAALLLPARTALPVPDCSLGMPLACVPARTLACSCACVSVRSVHVCPCLVRLKKIKPPPRNAQVLRLAPSVARGDLPGPSPPLNAQPTATEVVSQTPGAAEVRACVKRVYISCTFACVHACSCVPWTLMWKGSASFHPCSLYAPLSLNPPSPPSCSPLQGPLLVLDGAHTRESAAALVASVREAFPAASHPLVLVRGWWVACVAWVAWMQVWVWVRVWVYVCVCV